jgi:phosphodiesterase/alkaline phosphatase D-like protein
MWLWLGGVTDSAAEVVAKLDSAATACRLAVSATADFASPSYGPSAAPNARDYVRLSVTGLTPSSLYYYRVEVDGVVDSSVTGELRTFPEEGIGRSFCFAFASCNYTGSDHPVFSQIAGKRPAFFLHLGDKHYENISTASESLHRAAHEANLAEANQALMHRSVPVVYVWDDHDFGPNNSDGTYVGKTQAAAVYREMVPSYPLEEASGPIYHSFRYGRVLFIVTDLRYSRSPNSDTDNSSKTMLGTTQKQWLKGLLADAAADETVLVVWANTQQWNIDSSDFDPGDYWGAFSTERSELATYMQAVGAPPVVIVSGDAHNLAATSQYFIDGRFFTVLQAAAIDHEGHDRGGAWEVGPINGGGQYGMLYVDDDPRTGTLGLRWFGFSVDETTGEENIEIQLSVSLVGSGEYTTGAVQGHDGTEESIRVLDT